MSETDVIIEEGTKEIDENTIKNHRNLTSVKLPESLLVIGDGSFANCINLKNIIIPAGVVSIGRYAFANCISLESIEIPDGVKTIEECAFVGCECLESLILPETVTQIKNKAFEACTGIKNLVLPSNLTSCAADAFPSSKTYLPVNKAYKYDNGIMINKSNNILLFYDGDAKNVATPEDVKGIARRAFYGTSVERVRITENVTSIGEEAFVKCKNPISIYIPESVDYIESSAFDKNCKIFCKKASYSELWAMQANFKRV